MIIIIQRIVHEVHIGMPTVKHVDIKSKNKNKI